MSFTSNLTLEKPANNADVNTWDVNVNANTDILDAFAGGHTSLSVTAAAGVVALTATQYRPRIILVTGVLTAAVNYQLPSGVGGTWAVFNNTTGAFTLTWSSAGGGTSVLLAQGFTTAVICEGTNVGLMQTAVGTAGGATTQVQYNSASLLTGSANLTFSGTVLALKGTLSLVGASSGAVGLSVPAAAGGITYVLPANAGSSGQFLTSDGIGGLTWTGAVGGVTSFSAGSTGLTPSTGTGGAVTLAGTLGTPNGGTGLTAFTSGGAVYASSASVLTTGTLPATAGGTGCFSVPTAGQMLIGTGGGFALSTLTAGAGIMLTNGAGAVTIAATSSGTVTSVGVSGGTTGLTTSGGPITSTGNITLAGTLAVANGGTGAVTASAARTALGLGTGATANTGTSGANVPLLNGANTWSAAQTLTVAPVFTDQSGTRTALGLGTAATQNTGTSGANVGLLNGTNTYGGYSTFSGGVLAAGGTGSGTVTAALSHVGGTFDATGGGTTYTLNLATGFSQGSRIRVTFTSPGAGGTVDVSVAGGYSMLWIAGSGGTGTRTITYPGFIDLELVTGTVWWVTSGVNVT